MFLDLSLGHELGDELGEVPSARYDFNNLLLSSRRPWRNKMIFTWAFISSEMILSLKQFDGNILHALASNSFYQTKNL